MDLTTFQKKQLSGKIIARMLGDNEKEIGKWFDEYVSHYQRESGIIDITPQFRKMAEEYFRGIPASRLIREYGLSNNAKFWKVVAYVEREKNTKNK